MLVIVYPKRRWRGVLDVDDEDEGVVLFDLLHGGLGVERIEEDGCGIEPWLML
jgi:hypothetical protein